VTVDEAVSQLLIALGEHIVQGSLEVHFDHARYQGHVTKKHHKRSTSGRAVAAPVTEQPVRPA